MRPLHQMILRRPFVVQQPSSFARFHNRHAPLGSMTVKDKVIDSTMLHTVHCFDNGDASYLEWIKGNPRGHVINTRRGKEHGTGMLHRADCAHIRSMRNSDAPGGFTERGWIKFCGTDLHELVDRYADQRNAPLLVLTRCKACNAIAHDIIIERTPGESGTPLDGAKTTITVNARERDPLLRSICLEHHGIRCAACGVDMHVRYGPLGKGFMEVHEIPPSEPGGPGREFDPRRDLVPVCPNCHTMLHRGRETPLTVQELQTVIQRAVRHWSEVLFNG